MNPQSLAVKIMAAVILLPSVSTGAVYARPLRVSPDQRFFARQDGRPFFWLGDTGWLLFKKCTREETLKYLDTRRRQGFNVIQVMLLHDLKDARNAYNQSAIKGSDVSKPQVKGN